MKSYTSIEQSKILAKILPIESADMYWFRDNTEIPKIYPKDMMKDSVSVTLACWSLAALLEQLKSEIILENKQILFLHINKYDDTDYEIRYTNSWTGEVFIAEADNLIDACVSMIEKLNESSLL
jgi:hypothetical protein